jgi:hypothetical protein
VLLDCEGISLHGDDIREEDFESQSADGRICFLTVILGCQYENMHMNFVVRIFCGIEELR